MGWSTGFRFRMGRPDSRGASCIYSRTGVGSVYDRYTPTVAISSASSGDERQATGKVYAGEAVYGADRP